MKHPIEDAKVDAIIIEPAPRRPKSYEPVVVSVGDELLAIKNLLETIGWTQLDLCAKQSVEGIGFSNAAGDTALFAGNLDLEPDIKPFEGVLFTDFLGNQAVVSEVAFRRLMDRFFTILIEISNERHLKIRADPRWPVFLEYAERMKQLARGASQVTALMYDADGGE